MSAESIRELRERTGAGFLECKKALEQNQNNIDKAIDYLREKGLAAASKKAGRSANDGKVHAYIHAGGKIGVLVEVNCETDFVAKTDEFQAFVNDIALHIAAASPRYLNKEMVPSEDIEKERAVYKAQALESGKPANVVDKIVDGKISKFYEEVCLMNQKFVKDPATSIEDLLKSMIARMGENMTIRRYVRFQLGETGKANS